jgi:hypothetical protein
MAAGNVYAASVLTLFTSGSIATAVYFEISWQGSTGLLARSVGEAAGYSSQELGDYKIRSEATGQLSRL